MADATTEDDRPPAAERPTAAAFPGAAPVSGRVLRSRDLLAGAAEVAILHGREVYRLRLTGNDKLILTK